MKATDIEPLWCVPPRAICILSLACVWAIYGVPVLAQLSSQSTLKQQSEVIQELFRTQRYEAIRILGAERSESARALLLEIA
jgi:hypothetical protein